VRALAPERPLVLVTTHRRESFGASLRSICAAVAELAKTLGDHDFVIPMHPNPNVREAMSHELASQSSVHRVKPLEYLDFVHLMARARLILTDSGGIQEEAPSLRVPVLVLRDVTERPEGVEAGVARLVGTQRARIVAESLRILRDPDAHAGMACAVNPYGDGQASERIADALAERFSSR
jgi:UDP-N-acetylglucosamine 2-epimerase (non-hydrolysing)